MNRHFVNIKVDREERPDLDQIYQTAHQMLTRRGGGWPLTMFLTPRGTPFFAGTISRRPRATACRVSKSCSSKIAPAYRDQRSRSRAERALMQALTRSAPQAPAATRAHTRADRRRACASSRRYSTTSTAARAGTQVSASRRARVLSAPPRARRQRARGQRSSKLTLTKMAEGGIYDQIGGGFCRYSTDELWTIPHFEKMLYDNGPLLALYADAWQSRAHRCTRKSCAKPPRG
jgi:uncharacterized protein YyaL (SSP411 family)